MGAHRSIGVPGKHLSLPVPRLVTTGLSGCPRLDYSRDVSVTASGDRLMKLAIALGTAASILSAAGHTDLAPTIAQAAQASAPEAASGRLNVPVVYYKLSEWPEGRALARYDQSDGVRRDLLQHRLPQRAEGSHRVCASLRAHDVPGLGESWQDGVHPTRRVEWRTAQRIDAVRFHELLPGRAVTRARTDSVGRSGPHALARHRRREPEEPAGSREE